MIVIKVRKSSDGKVLVALCDKNLLGKKIEDGNLQLDLASSFYKGEDMDEEKEKEFDNLTKQNCYLNVVGEESLEFCIKHKLVDKDKIIKIKDVPHAQAVIVRE